MKDYGTLLRDDRTYADKAAQFSAEVRDINELLDELDPVATRHPIPGRQAYHDARHLSHAQQIRSQPRAVLGTIPELEVIDIPETNLCCGSAGIYNLVSVAPDMIATANPGCMLQIRRYLDPPVPLYHPVQLVDFSLRGINPLITDAGNAEGGHQDGLRGRRRRPSR